MNRDNKFASENDKLDLEVQFWLFIPGHSFTKFLIFDFVFFLSFNQRNPTKKTRENAVN